MTTKIMHPMINQSLIYSLYKIGSIQFGEFTLKSGKTSSIYINLRKVISYPLLLQTIAQAMWEATKNSSFDLVCGVPYTALPIATCISLEYKVPMVIRRKEKKDYGTKKLIEGEFKAGQNCLVVEDVVTTGGSLIETAQELENEGLNITDLVALIDREQGPKENLMKNYRLHALFSLSQVLTTLFESSLLNTEERMAIETFLKERH